MRISEFEDLDPAIKRPHPQRGSYYPSIETIGYASIKDQNLEEKDEMPQASRPAVHKKQTIPRNTTQDDPMYKLLYKYTGSDANVWNNVLHRHYRQQRHGKSHFGKINQVDQYLQKFPLQQNLKVYTGIPESPSRVWEKYGADVRKPVRVHLPAYTSTTTNYTIAYINFAREDRISPQDHPARNVNSVSFPVYKGLHILHITVPKGYPALSLVDVSRYGDEEEEILLPRGLDIEIDPRPYIKPTPGQPGIVWFAKVVGHNPVVLK